MEKQSENKKKKNSYSVWVEDLGMDGGFRKFESKLFRYQQIMWKGFLN